MTDNNFSYQAGDVFPREGLEVGQDRIDQLLSDKNRLKQAVIEEISEIAVVPENVNKGAKTDEAANETEDVVLNKNVSKETEKEPKTAPKKRGKQNVD